MSVFPKQTSVSAAAMTDPNPFADGEVIVCYGAAKSTEKHHRPSIALKPRLSNEQSAAASD